MLPHRAKVDCLLLPVAVLMSAVLIPVEVGMADGLTPDAKQIVKNFCIDCHNAGEMQGGMNLEQLSHPIDWGSRFKTIERLIQVIQSQTMPPKDHPLPSESQRLFLTNELKTGLDRYVRSHEGDPGESILRRLTSAEYAYTLKDITGLELGMERSFVNDGVGGEGFTNVGTAQFVEDASIVRYLEAAKRVSDHAVIGAGPLRFFADAGETGRELSAMRRISDIYRRYGFRTGAGEGAEPFGLDLYWRALFVAWQYEHRMLLGLETVTLQELAVRESISPRLCEHVSNLMQSPNAGFPLSIIIDAWRSLPRPALGGELTQIKEIRSRCAVIGQTIREWQSMLADGAGDEEEASVLTSGIRQVHPRNRLRADINWREGVTVAAFEISVSAASTENAAEAITVWKEPKIRFRKMDGRNGEFAFLSKHLTTNSGESLRFSKHPSGGTIGEHDFVLPGQTTVHLEMAVPEGTRSAQLDVTVELDLIQGENRIVRCRLSDGHVEGETAAETGATSSLLADPNHPHVQQWMEDVARFAQLLPEVSHREPAPSDRDPIPTLFDNTYNKPERNHFHTAIKYSRDDRFLVKHILDDTQRAELDEAWTDLLTAFDYHAQLIRFVTKKFADANPQENRKDLELAQLTPDSLSVVASPIRETVRNIYNEYCTMQQRLREAEDGHLVDTLKFCELAWRRRLTDTDRSALTNYYSGLRSESKLDHRTALRQLIARILVAPDFLYRIESSCDPSQNTVTLAGNRLIQLNDRELANRLSYFLWSSNPDAELVQLAEANRLRDPQVLEEQTRRMLKDPKARRMATEFFGQWLGFYRFDDFRGIDASRFPEFTTSLQRAMYDEAITFFEHIVRENRPLNEILFADYTFVNAELATHYQLDSTGLPLATTQQVRSVASRHRGGLLGLGAIHAITSAPLRTSAVKRGDWVLRRIIGSPVPPPPADVGSISADDIQADGLTVRKRLELHRENNSCLTCHSRIDPLGFALEHFDPIGRWRENYRDGLAIDASGVLTDGTEIRGLRGLLDYLRIEQTNFERNLASKLLGYALGRGELASDRPLLDQMQSRAASSGSLAELVLCIVQSRQFQFRNM